MLTDKVSSANTSLAGEAGCLSRTNRKFEFLIKELSSYKIMER
jgi:hypothetical protein